MQDGFAPAALAFLQHVGSTKAVQHDTPAVATAAAAAAASAAGALRAFTTADDERPPASKAFLHARQLAGNPHNALQVLLPVLQQLQAVKPLPVGPLTAVMAAVRQVGGRLCDWCCSFVLDSGAGTAVCTARHSTLHNSAHHTTHKPQRQAAHAALHLLLAGVSLPPAGPLPHNMSADCCQ